MAKVKFEDVKKIYDGKVLAAEDINITVEYKELLVLVGPSGCGKSTVLRMVAGLEEVTEGHIYFDDREVTELPPKDRNIAMVFQNYALYPHMTVDENMAFGLKLRKMEKDERKKRVKEAAEVLGIEKLLGRKPKALSGGQRQRVALGRAIVRNPDCFLFDEPLSNLDAKMRVQMRTEIRRLNLEIKTTMIYVTHDQVEAMTLGDRLAVMHEGRILQIGTPMELYHNPVVKFVASFIGSPAMNFIEGTVSGDEKPEFESEQVSFELPERFRGPLRESSESRSILGVRPEDLHVADPEHIDETIQFDTELDVAEPLGNEIIYHLLCKGKKLVSRDTANIDASHGDRLSLHVNLNKIHLFEGKSGSSLLAESN
jgi:multiple sugar transport system ATP-binding protein